MLDKSDNIGKQALPTAAPPKDETALIEKRLDDLSFRLTVLVAQSEESIKMVDQRSIDLRKVIRNLHLRETVIDDIISDIVAGACIHRITVYAAQLKENKADYAEN